MRITVNIPEKVKAGSRLVAIPHREYERWRKHRAEVQDATKKVKRGEKAYRQGKTRIIKSIRELL